MNTQIKTHRNYSTQKSTPAAKQETIRRREVRKAKSAATTSLQTSQTFDYGKVSR